MMVASSSPASGFVLSDRIRNRSFLGICLMMMTKTRFSNHPAVERKKKTPLTVSCFLTSWGVAAGVLHLSYIVQMFDSHMNYNFWGAAVCFLSYTFILLLLSDAINALSCSAEGNRAFREMISCLRWRLWWITCSDGGFLLYSYHNNETNNNLWIWLCLILIQQWCGS